MTPFTYLDVALVGILFISGLLATFRGLSRELLSIVSWAAGAAAGLYTYLGKPTFVNDISSQTGAPLQIAQVVIAIVVGVIVLIIIELITARISDSLLDSRIGMIDRVLGLLFGLARGFILIVVPFMFYESFIQDTAAHPAWVREAKSLPYIKRASDALRQLLVQYVPSSLTAPTGEQQGLIDLKSINSHVALSRGNYHITVTRQAG